jgi:NADPH:quinone reductase-like Zn-dependent oxidoreductase
VIATASPNHAALLRSLGAAEVIDYHTVHVEDTLSNVDVVLNTVDAPTGERSVRVLKPGGVLVSVVHALPDAQCATAKIRCEITGPVTGAYLGALADLVDHHQLRVVVDQKLPLADAAKAWELSRGGHTAGKIVLEVSR